MSDNRLSALVTGGSRGIGRAIAAHLAERGYDLTICARDLGRLDDTAEELRKHGVTVTVCQADMADDEAVAAAVELHRTTYHRMSALVLAAGVGSAGPIAGYPMRRLDKQFAVNVRAPFALVGAALPLLRETAAADPATGARIVALSSLEGLYPESGLAGYGASKAALISLVRSINMEEGGNGVTATAISPAYVDTDMSAWVSDRIPQSSMIAVADVVKVVDLVLSLSQTALIPHVVINRVGAGEFVA